MQWGVGRRSIKLLKKYASYGIRLSIYDFYVAAARGYRDAAAVGRRDRHRHASPGAVE